MEDKKVSYYGNGKISAEYYFKNDIYHCESGPAVKVYSYSGKIEYEEYRINGGYIID